MISIKAIAEAFIFNNDKVLLMERSTEKKFAPGLWGSIGGVVEPTEMNYPKVACLREIKEETGLVEDQLQNLDLRYIIISKSDTEIKVEYVYFGTTSEVNIRQCDEGISYWISEAELFDRTFITTINMTLKHYIEHRNDLNKIMVGVVDENNGEPIMNWNSIEDWKPNSFI